MARVTYGGGVTEFAGSIGGVTFLRNASGPIVKLRSNPPVNPSPDQSTYQTILALLVAHWPTISQANKDTWNVIAAAHDHTTPWGETKTLSGYQWYLSCNLFRYAYYGTITDGSYAWQAPAPPDSFTIEVDPTYIRCAWSPNYDPTWSLFVYASLPLRQSSIKLRRSLFLIKRVLDLGSVANYDITSEIETLFNVDWGTFYASADCSIIIRLRHGLISQGWMSAFTSAIVKI